MPDTCERGARYRSAESRARALYRVPAAPTGDKTLVLFHRRQPLWHAVPEAAENISLCNLDAGEFPVDATLLAAGATGEHANCHGPLPFGDEAFDRVILHRTLDELAATASSRGTAFDPRTLIEQIRRVLKPGGIVAGCVDNRIGLKSLLRRAKWRLSGAGDMPESGYFTANSLQKALQTGRLADVQIFIVLPDCDDPVRLVDSDRGVAKAVFRHEMLAASQLWSRFGYLLRRAAVELGFFTRFEASFFFWARK